MVGPLKAETPRLICGLGYSDTAPDDQTDVTAYVTEKIERRSAEAHAIMRTCDRKGLR